MTSQAENSQPIPSAPINATFPEADAIKTGWKWSFISSWLFRKLFERELSMIAAAGARAWQSELISRCKARKEVNAALDKSKTLSDYNRKRFAKTYGRK